MKNSKKGISLIVLIITIIVIIILATVILVSVINNNPISEANKARYESDRDNMQAVFTNTVGKIMAENQGVVNVTAGQINTETTGVNETTGEVAYTVDNATVAENSSGTIKFDKGTNNATTYYTGKKLPIYAAGETKWYVDSEGVLSLEVAGVKYGSGEVESEETLAAGLYSEDGTMVMTWEELIKEGYFYVDENKILYGSLDGCSGYSNEARIDGLEGKLVVDSSVESIGDYCFGCSIDGFGTMLSEIILPRSIISIGEGAFAYCSNLTAITIPTTVTNIGMEAFIETPWFTTKQQENSLVIVNGILIDGTTSSDNVIIPNSVTEIKSSAFNACTNLTSITIPDSVTSIGSNAFSGCSGLTSIIVDENNTKYDSRNNCNAIIETFTNTLIQGCGNTIIPNSVISVGENAFKDCKNLTSIEIPYSVTSIKAFAFSGCSGLTSVTISNSVESIGNRAFYRCSNLTSIDIPDSITSLRGTFDGCASLTTVTIPDSVTSIGIDTFKGCKSLTSIYIPLSVTEIDGTGYQWCPFHNCLSTLKIYCGASSKPSGWGTYWNYCDSGKTLSTTYGITREVYESTYKQ